MNGLVVEPLRVKTGIVYVEEKVDWSEVAQLLVKISDALLRDEIFGVPVHGMDIVARY